MKKLICKKLDFIFRDVFYGVIGIVAACTYIFFDFSPGHPDPIVSSIIFGFRVLGLGASLFLIFIAALNLSTYSNNDRGSNDEPR